MKVINLLLLTGALLLVGCTRNHEVSPHANTLTLDGLSVSIELPGRTFTVGEQFKVVLTAYNTTNKPMEILADNGSLIYVRIWRRTGEVWEDVKTYPTATIDVKSPWTLDPHTTRSFTMELTVEPDWPRGEILRVTGELNGRTEVSPGLTVEVNPQSTPHGE